MTLEDIKFTAATLTESEVEVKEIDKDVIQIITHTDRLSIRTIKDIVKFVGGRKGFDVFSVSGNIGIEINTVKHGYSLLDAKRVAEILPDGVSPVDIEEINKVLPSLDYRKGEW